MTKTKKMPPWPPPRTVVFVAIDWDIEATLDDFKAPPGRPWPKTQAKEESRC